MLQKLLIFSLLLGAASCSTLTQTLVEGLSESSSNPTYKISTSIGDVTPPLAEQSSKKAAMAMAKEYSIPSKAKTSLDAYKWKNRLLLVMAPDENNPSYQQQMQLLQGQQAGFNERDLLIFELLAQGTSRINGQSIDAEEAARIRKRFNIDSQAFCVILVGKDGTSKRSDRAPVSPEIIYREIDAMPMRRQEMNRNG